MTLDNIISKEEISQYHKELKPLLKKKTIKEYEIILNKIQERTINMASKPTTYIIQKERQEIGLKNHARHPINDLKSLRTISLLHLLSSQKIIQKKDLNEYINECLTTAKKEVNKKQTKEWLRNMYQGMRTYIKANKRQTLIKLIKPINYEII